MPELTWTGKWEASSNARWLGGELDGHCIECNADFWTDRKYEVRFETNEGIKDIILYGGGGCDHEENCHARGGHPRNSEKDLLAGIAEWVRTENQRRKPNPVEDNKHPPVERRKVTHLTR